MFDREADQLRRATVDEIYAKMTDFKIRNEKQMLIDIMFEIAIRMQMGTLKFETREKCAEYVSEQLAGCGFETRPVGSSWGVLK